jgi:anti-sigma B factor antagonist
MASTFAVSVRPDGSGAGSPESLVVALDGELDISTAPQLAARIDELLGAGLRHLVVDVSGLTFVDVAGLRALSALRTQARQQLIALRLTGASRHIRRVLGIASPAGNLTASDRDGTEPLDGRPRAWPAADGRPPGQSGPGPLGPGYG